MPESRQRSTRAPLSRDRIVEAALALAREKGLSGVSMRQLGRELGVQPMSLYHHIPSRAVLMVMMAARSVAMLPEPDPTLTWDQRLTELLLHTYQAGLDDPAVFPVLASESLAADERPALQAESAPASVELIQTVLALLREGGIPQAEQMSACRALIGLVVGFVVGQVDGLAVTTPEDDPMPQKEMSWSEHSDETAVEVLSALHTTSPEDDLRFGIDRFIAGLRAAGRAGSTARG